MSRDNKICILFDFLTLYCKKDSFSKCDDAQAFVNFFNCYENPCSGLDKEFKVSPAPSVRTIEYLTEQFYIWKSLSTKPAPNHSSFYPILKSLVSQVYGSNKFSITNTKFKNFELPHVSCFSVSRLRRAGLCSYPPHLHCLSYIYIYIDVLSVSLSKVKYNWPIFIHPTIMTI